ncbi:ABC transporter substrate-binding protein [Paenibacillus sepulcri]|uniref:ABC transporter substrate-binding protein n=1 Tax=Paenibacillus sepulcri TaxID=359917 RepID=A0ABS7BXC2_9BACL|nr:ABC transporter substrate-binding protein [Paenibacillus sepulcri]
MKQRKMVWPALLLSLLVLTVFLQACSGREGRGNPGQANSPADTGGNQQPADSSPATSPAEPADSAAADLAPYEVSIVYFGKPQRDGALVEAKMSEYLKEKINATVKLRPIASSDYQTKTELMMNTGESMDLVFTASWLNYFGNITKGAFLELDELLDKHGQGIKETINSKYLEAPRLNGKLYAIPTNKEITQGKSWTYRKDIVDKYNIPIEQIQTISDLEPWFKVLKEKEPGLIINFVGNSIGGSGMMYETRSNFRPIGPTPNQVPLFLIDYTSQDIQVKTVLDQEIVSIIKPEYELMRSFFEKGYTNADAGTTKANIGDLRKQGKIWIQGAVWKPGADIELKLSTDNKYDFVSHVVEEPIVTTDLATGSMMSISRTSQDPERAMMVLNLLHTDPYLINLMVHGIEDMHYKKTVDNRIEWIPDSGYQSGISWVVGSQMLNYLLPGQPDDLYENWKTFNDEAKAFPLMGFVFDDTKVKPEVAQLTSIITEYSMIATGAVPEPSKMVDERNVKLKDAGIEKVAAELQTQIDAWRAANNK